MKSNHDLFEILKSENGKNLFREVVLTEYLNRSGAPILSLEDRFESAPYQHMNLEILSHRKLNLAYPNWLKFQQSYESLVNNIHYLVELPLDTPHHLLRDGLNESHSNIEDNHGYQLKFFTSIHYENSSVCFWLHTKDIAVGSNFIATTLVYSGFNDLFYFDPCGKCAQ